MLTLNDIINVSFRKAGFSGYRTDDVDNFVDQVRDSFELMQKKNIEQKEDGERREVEKQELQKKLEILAAKVEEYRQEEDGIKNALVSAQRLGDASVREARHKSEIIIKDANLKAERIIASANEQIAAQNAELVALKKKVSDFRSHLLDLYKEHLTMIDALPTEKEAPPRQQPAPEPRRAAPEPVQSAYQEPVPAEDHWVIEEDINFEAPAREEPTGEFSFRTEVANFEEELPSTGSTTRFNAIRLDDEFGAGV